MTCSCGKPSLLIEDGEPGRCKEAAAFSAEYGAIVDAHALGLCAFECDCANAWLAEQTVVSA